MSASAYKGITRPRPAVWPNDGDTPSRGSAPIGDAQGRLAHLRRHLTEEHRVQLPLHRHWRQTEARGAHAVDLHLEVGIAGVNRLIDVVNALVRGLEFL